MSSVALDLNKQLAGQFLQRVAGYEVERCLALMTPDATWWVCGDSTRLKAAGSKDRAQIARLLQGLARFVPQPMTVCIRGMTAEADRVAVEAECTGTWRDGRLYHNRYHFLLEVQGELIRGVREYMDTQHLFEMLQHEAAPRSPA